MKGDAVYLRHILDAILRIESYIVVGRDTFMSTPHWQDACDPATGNHRGGGKESFRRPPVALPRGSMAPNRWIARRIDP
jgi:hypothetical protein